MIKTNLLKKGLIIQINNKNYSVLEVNFLKPGKGGAFYKTKLKEIITHKVVEKTFKSGELIESPNTEKKNLTFLYSDHKIFYFHDEESFEQYEFPIDFIEEKIKKFLKEGETLILTLINNEPVYLEFKKTKITYKVIDAPPAIKGDSVSNSYRPIIIETKAEVMTPLFIKENDLILVNVETGEYCSREK